jgi:DEAD/DEAH box helicase domain-containing protein
VTPTDADYYTRPSITEKIQVLATRGESIVLACQLAWGDVRVTSQATGYRVIRRGTNEVLGFGEISLPEQTLETQACWLALSARTVERLRAAGAWASDVNDYGPGWPALRDAIRARDGFRCQGCGAAEPPGRSHDVHHRVPLRVFLADPALRPGLPAEHAWEAANRPANLVTLCTACHRQAEASVRIRTGLGGLAALLAGIAPLFLMCDPSDLGALAEMQAPATGRPTVTLYDRAPGGVGYAGQLCASMPDLLAAARAVVRGCPCAAGCPGCVGPAPEHEYALNVKALAAAILDELTSDHISS